MALVDYSDSEGSDAEESSSKPPGSESVSHNAPSQSSKSGFQKVVDRTNPHKIRVNLPEVGTEGQKSVDIDTEIDGEHRPSKRAKTGGAFSSFNSFLPAPKNPAKATGGAGSSAVGALARSRGPGLGHGVNLKTGAAPAFSREQASSGGDGDEFEPDVPNGTHQHNALDAEALEASTTYDAPPDPAQEVKLVGKPMMFKPLSVARKPPKKKKPALEKGTMNASESAQSVTSVAVAPATTIPAPEQPAPKRSLFSTFDQESIPSTRPSAATNGSYEPLLGVGAAPDVTEEEPPAPQSHAVQIVNAAEPQTTSLNDLADNLHLTPAQRRQLFGRNGASGAQDVRVSSFSVATEYTQNNAMIASGENAAPAHNPVRSIAPGKHSLQQLVNAASNQKEALEESFATGKRNKKEAGNKYGW